MESSHAANRRRASVEAMGVALAAALFSAAWTALVGQDVGWDLLNHHVYLPFSLLSGRHTTDLYAAGPQSFQNPIGYLPFYLLVQAQFSARAVGLSLAALQGGLMAWSLWRVNCVVFGADVAGRPWRLIAATMALVSPIYLYTVGTSGNDLWGAAFVLLCVPAILQSRPRGAVAAVAGASLGIALAIKPTNAVFALPLTALVIVHAWTGFWRRGSGFAFGAGLIAGAGIAGGYWAAWLLRDFGSPSFPLFNHWFQSPFAPVGEVVALRFLPTNTFEGLNRLWAMASTSPYIMVEAVMPDARPLAALLAAALAVFLCVRRKGIRGWPSCITSTRVDTQLGLVLALSYVLWMLTSGNARYAVPWFLLIGVALVRAAQVSWPTVSVLALLVLLAGLQVLVFLGRGDMRSLARPWADGPYIPVQAPRHLVEEPYLHLSLGGQSYAGLAPFLHPAGAMSNLSGQMALPTTGPLGDRLMGLLHRWKGRTRFLFAPALPLGSPQLAAAVDAENWALIHRVGLQIDLSRCDIIQTMSATGLSVIGSATVLSCPAVAAQRADPALDRTLAEADALFARVEAACPRIFGPSPMASEYLPSGIWRRYMNSDAQLTVSAAGEVTVLPYRASGPAVVGDARDVVANPHLACLAWTSAKP